MGEALALVFGFVIGGSLVSLIGFSITNGMEIKQTKTETQLEICQQTVEKQDDQIKGGLMFK